MSIRPHVEYSSKMDKLIGFDARKCNEEHLFLNDQGNFFCIDFSIFFTPISILVALVFLLKGIVKPFKQPVAVYYCEKSYKAELMAEEVKALITQLNEQKMSVKVIVNDGGSNMILLRKLLCGDAKWFTVNSQHVCNRKILSLTIVWIFHIKRISIKF